MAHTCRKRTRQKTRCLHLRVSDPDIPEPWESLDQAPLQLSAAFLIACTYSFAPNSLVCWGNSELYPSILDQARVTPQILALLKGLAIWLQAGH